MSNIELEREFLAGPAEAEDALTAQYNPTIINPPAGRPPVSPSLKLRGSRKLWRTSYSLSLPSTSVMVLRLTQL